MAPRWWIRRSHRTMMVWVGLLVVLTIAAINPLRNAFLYPVWPSQWRPVGSYRLLKRHVVDLFYPMDRQPYTGSCQQVTSVLRQRELLSKAENLFHNVHVYTQSQWDHAEDELRRHHNADTMEKLRFFRPALTELEQRTLLRNLFVLTSALDAFNVTYMAAEGTLIGSLRYRGLVPWDDDADVTFPADQWHTAKRVLSCIPGYELKIYSDFLWKFYSLDSPLWKGETKTRFPYIDLFPYVEDEEYVWPLIIWLKDKMLWPRKQVFPTRHVTFEGFRIRVPNDVPAVLKNLFGDVNICESRLFERREKRLTTQEERVRIECSLLGHVYPFYSWPGSTEKR